MGSSHSGCLLTPVDFFFGLLLRPALALALTPVQVIISRISGVTRQTPAVIR